MGEGNKVMKGSAGRGIKGEGDISRRKMREREWESSRGNACKASGTTLKQKNEKESLRKRTGAGALH